MGVAWLAVVFGLFDVVEYGLFGVAYGSADVASDECVAAWVGSGYAVASPAFDGANGYLQECGELVFVEDFGELVVHVSSMRASNSRSTFCCVVVDVGCV